MALLLPLVVAVLLVTILIFRVITPPSTLPRNIPTIPFYVSLLGFFRPIDQLEIFAQHIEPALRRHGAAKYYFGARWNILVQRSELLSEVLKHENIYAKSGNQKKIPYSVLAAFTGDNVISAHGETWKLYRNVMQPGLQRQDYDVHKIRESAQKLVMLMDVAQKGASAGRGVMVTPFIQQFAMQTLGETVLKTDFGTLRSPPPKIHTIHSQLKMQIFKPLYLTLPFLDRFPIRSRIRARDQVHEFEEELVKVVLEQTAKLPDDDDSLISLMKRARRDGLWTDRQLRDNLKIVFIAGHENVQQLLTSLLYVLAKYPIYQSQLRESLRQTVDHESLKSSALLTSIILETLRLLPPIPQLANRKTTRSVILGDLIIPANTYIAWSATGAHRDPAVWGDDAGDFKPERWGVRADQMHAKMRKHTSKAEFIPFHGGRRACLGQSLALLEIRIALVELMRSHTLRFENDTVVKFTPGGLLAPMGMRLIFEKAVV